MRPQMLGSATLVLAAAGMVYTQVEQARSFDVASVRLSAPAPGPASLQVLDTRVAIIGQPLRSILRLAFRAKDYQLSAPGWLEDVRVDIQATLPAGATRQQVPEMLQALLAQRFGLVVHREPWPLEVYELVVDASGIKKMEEVAPRNELDRAFPMDPGFATPSALAFADRVSETPDGPVRTIIGGGGEAAITTVTARSMYRLTISDRQTQILNATRMTMADLAALLERVTGQPVLDKTNLVALYKFTIELPPHNLVRDILIRSGSIISDSPSLAAPPMELASEAVRGVGLRLERRRSQIETIVVDRIERPTPN